MNADDMLTAYRTAVDTGDARTLAQAVADLATHLAIGGVLPTDWQVAGPARPRGRKTAGDRQYARLVRLARLVADRSDLTNDDLAYRSAAENLLTAAGFFDRYLAGGGSLPAAWKDAQFGGQHTTKPSAA